MRTLSSVRRHFSHYHLKSGVFHFYRGEHERAVEFLTRVLTDPPEQASEGDRSTALYYLVHCRIGSARAHEIEGEVELAIEQYQKAVDVRPGYADVQFRLGRTLARSGRAEEALEHLGAATEINPLYIDAHVEKGMIYLAQKRRHDAQECFRSARDARAKRCADAVKNAELALEKGRHEEAADRYRHAFLTDFSSFGAIFRQSLTLLREESWDDAAEALVEAARLCPRFADVQNYLGVAQAENGEFAQAILSFERSIDIDHGYLVAWLNLAFAALEHGDIELARRAIDRVNPQLIGSGPTEWLMQALSEQPQSPTAKA